MRSICGWVLILGFAPCMGCAMCDSSYDNHYAAYGGLFERLDREHGRVGSVFAPAAVAGPEAGVAPAGVGSSPVVSDMPASNDQSDSTQDGDARLQEDLQDALRSFPGGGTAEMDET